jgi:wyosine [tRNA(Phe)-imidazoG37] synthetase (radical SAM superfamily)
MIEALNLFDERIVRLDVGSERVFKQITQPIARVSLDRVVSGARSLRDTWLTAIFFEGAIANLPTTELEEWFELIGMIRPKGIVLRAPRSTSGHIHPVSEDQLDSLAARIERRIQIRPKVFLL